MFIELFFKECKQILKSIIYYIFIICLAAFCLSQMSDVKNISKPKEGQKNYGQKYSHDEDDIIKGSIVSLEEEYKNNSYVTYPIGWYKEVKLDNNNQDKICDILNNIKDSKISYDDFKEKMGQVDKILGGKSKYKADGLYRNAIVSATYDDAIKSYNSILEDDKVTGAFARLFCDYMGIVLGILPVFLVVSRCLKDKKSNACEVIYSKKVKTSYIIFSRYLALVVMTLIPVFLVSINTIMQAVYIAASNGVTPDYIAFVKYIFGWLLPTILFVLSVGFFFTTLTDGPVAILVQAVVWFLSIIMGSLNLVGKVGINMVPRFNTLGSYDIYSSMYNELLFNRIFYVILSIIIMMFTVFIYNLKRKGVIGLYGKVFANWKGKLKIQH